MHTSTNIPWIECSCTVQWEHGMSRLWLLQEKKCKRNKKKWDAGKWVRGYFYVSAESARGTDYCLAAVMPELHVTPQLCEPSSFLLAHPQGMLSFLLVQPLLSTLFHVILTDKSRVGGRGHSVIPHFCLLIAVLAGLELLRWFLRSRFF